MSGSVIEAMARVKRRVRRGLRGVAQRSVKVGLPPSWLGYRRVRHETVPQLRARRSLDGDPIDHETVHPAQVARNPLPRNVDRREELPDDRGWWGFAFRDVPERPGGETFIATVGPARVLAWLDDKGGQFHPAILTPGDRSLDLREIRFRPGHATRLRVGGPRVHRERVTWVTERVYHNHSHWLTAHLPKLLLLRERDRLDDVMLPATLSRAARDSLRAIGLDADGFERFDPAWVLEVEELTVLGTDRFRPELLGLVQTELGGQQHGGRRVFISRSGATRRRLLNEEELWPLLEGAGFERVRMEELSFDQQLALMRETSVLVAPHGAGLTNMLFCPPGTAVVEIADLGFPNPNFYATAVALGHDYWIVRGEAVGDVHPLEQDLRVDVSLVARTLEQVLR